MLKGDIKGKVKFKQNTKSNILYSELFQQYKRSCEIKGRSVNTIKTYQFHHNYFMEFLSHYFEHQKVYCSDINLKVLEEYIYYIKTVKEITNGVTINSYLHNISPVIKFGTEKGEVPKDFKIPFVKHQETFKEIYTQEELQTLLAKPKDISFTSIRTWAIIWLFASTGIRSSELRELKVGAVDLYNRTIVVNNTKNKKPRVLPISLSLGEVMEEYLELRDGEPDEYLFCSVYGGVMARTTLQKAIKLHCNQRGVDKTSLHLFRHTFITNAVNSNVSPLILKKITGHSTLKELNRYYNATTYDTVEIIDNIAPKLNNKVNKFKK